MNSKEEREKLKREIRKGGHTVKAGKELLSFKLPLSKKYNDFFKEIKSLAKLGGKND